MEQLQQLIELCKRQDRRAQERLFRLFHNYVLTITSRYAGNEAEARDILQDAFVKIFHRLDQFDPAGDFKGWLRRIVVNTAIDYWRARQGRIVSDALSENMDPGIEPTAIDQLQTVDLLRLIQKLPNSYRLVFSLFVVEGFQHDEIATPLGISVGTSKSTLFKAKARLQEWVLEYYTE